MFSAFNTIMDIFVGQEYFFNKLSKINHCGSIYFILLNLDVFV